MLKLNKLMFFTSMVIGTMITISSHSWFSIWLGLEINLLSVIPLMIDKNSQFSTEASLKYFLIQTIASSLLMLAILIILNLQDQMVNYFMDSSILIMNSSLFMKMGGAPFHAWFPEVMEGLNWLSCLLMMTWQKLGPMIILVNNISLNEMLTWVVIFSSLIAGILGINQTSLRKIMAYSSINHIAWMLASMMTMTYIWSIYFLLYTFISISTVIHLQWMKIYWISQMNRFSNFNNLVNITNFLSLAGIPPFLGFFPKWLVIQSLIQSKNLFLSLILVVLTLLTIFFYLRITFSSIMLITVKSVINFKTSNNYKISILLMIHLTGLALSTLIFNF